MNDTEVQLAGTFLNFNYVNILYHAFQYMSCHSADTANLAVSLHLISGPNS